MLQTATYVAMHTLAEARNDVDHVLLALPAAVCGRLFNIRTGQLSEVRVAEPLAFLETFITAKLNSGITKISDVKFIEACKCGVNTGGSDDGTETIDFMDVSDKAETIQLENSERKREREIPIFSF